MKKIVTTIILVLLLIIIGLGAYFTFGSFSQGYRAGSIIKLSKKGVMFKTWEGDLNLGTIPTGNNNEGSSPGNIWQFSVTDEAVVSEIEKAVDTGKRVKLRYKEKYFQFEWIGDTKYIVYAVEEVE